MRDRLLERGINAEDGSDFEYQKLSSVSIPPTRVRIVPTRLKAMLEDKDPQVSQRVMKAIFQMKRLDIADLEKAYGGE